jgi:hypothetical protein
LGKPLSKPDAGFTKAETTCSVQPSLGALPVAKKNKPTGQHCVNVANGTTSYLLLRSHNKDFPDTTLNVITVQPGDSHDINNDFDFTATVIPQSKANRLALQLISNLPGGGGAPTDGLISITLTVTPTTGGGSTTQQLADVPVDYISDPAGP